LIQSILNPNPRKRPTIKAILQAKWMREADESSSDDEFNENCLINPLELRLVNPLEEDSKI